MLVYKKSTNNHLTYLIRALNFKTNSSMRFCISTLGIILDF